MCIFGDEYGECPVIPELQNQLKEQVQALKTVKIGSETMQELRVVMQELSASVMSYSYSLSQFCQACPKVEKNVLVVNWKEVIG